MKKFILLVSILTCFLFTPARTLAWGPVGHRVVAAIAFQALSDADKATVTNLFRYHSKYPAWVAGYAWDVPSHEVDFGTYLFMRASTWADEIKGSGSPYDHYDWHFADYPLRPPSFPDDPRLAPGNDVLEGIAQCERSLADGTGAAADRVAHLALLIHYLGDIHQPLHCSSLFTASYPTGDRGGNDFYVITNSAVATTSKLHGLWDGGLGTVENLTNEFKFATGLAAGRPRASYAQLAAHVTPESWSKEGRGLALTNAYSLGNLQGGTNAATARLLPAEYLGNLKTIAEQQAPLAGYRLADEIHRYLVAVSYPPPVTQPVLALNSIVAWLVGEQRNFGVSPLPVATNAAHVTSGGLVRGAGVGTSGSGASRAWGGNNFTSASKDAAIAAGKFITFSVAPDAGYKLSCSALGKFYYRRSASGPTNGLLQFQIGAGAFTDVANLSYPSAASVGVAIPPIDLTGRPALQNVPVGTTVTFRIVNWDGTATTGSWYVFDSADDTAADFALLGTVTAAAPPTSNLAPTAVATATTTAGAAPLTVTFSSAGSSDPEGAALTYNWSFGDGSTSSAANPTHTYSANGAYSARVSVSDGTYTTTSANIPITVGVLSPPTGLRVEPVR